MCDAIRYGPSRIEQCLQRKIRNGWTLQGHSKAGERTCFYIDPLNICLDAGLNTYKGVKGILISHMHSDHSQEWIHLLNRRKEPVKGQEEEIGRPVYFPESGYDSITGLYYANQRCGSGKKATMKYDESFLHNRMINPIKIKVGDVFKFPGLGDIWVEVLPAYHSVDSVGYGIFAKRNKIKPEYLALSKSKKKEDKAKFIEMRKNPDISLTEMTDIPQLMFFSDSTIDNLTKHEEWKKYPTIMVECTGFDEVSDADTIYERQHTHWDHLFPVMKENKDKEWIVIHTTFGINNDVIDKYQKIMDDNEIDGYIWKSGVVVDGKVFI